MKAPASTLRDAVLDKTGKRVLLVNYEATDQEGDLSEPPNCGGFGRVHHFRRSISESWPLNPLPLDPACSALQLPWPEEMRAEVFQIAACNWDCWYCYVPPALRRPDKAKAHWLSPAECVALYAKEPHRPRVIILSGGHPELAPEWVVWTMDALEASGLASTTYLWSDDNLSTSFLWDFLGDAELERMRRYRNYGRVGCFKGIDSESFSFNTGADSHLFEEQFALMRRLIQLGLDQYAYVTFTAPDAGTAVGAVPAFVDRLQAVHENLPLRTVPLKIRPYTPTQERLGPINRAALDTQARVADAWADELGRRFTATQLATRIHEVPLT